MKKLLSVIALTLFIILQLQLYAAAAADVYVYPQLRIMSGSGTEDYSQMGHQLVIIPSGEDQIILDYSPGVNPAKFDSGYDGTGIIVPLLVQNDLYLSQFKNYINNFSFQIFITDDLNTSPSAVFDFPLTAPLDGVYASSSYNGSETYTELDQVYSSGKTNVHFKGNNCDVYYSVNYSPLDPSYVDSTDNFLGVLNFDVTTVFFTGSTLPERLFLNIDFTNLFDVNFDYRIQIQSPTTAEVINANIDVINSKLSELHKLISQLNEAIGSLGSSFSGSGGGSSFNSLGEALGLIYSQSYYDSMIFDHFAEDINNKTEQIQKEIDDLNENMTGYVEQADKNTKDTFVKEATDGLNENFDKIMESVDIINTDAIESSMNLLYSSIDSDSMHPVLTVGAFTVPVLGETYTLWDSFDIDIVDLSQKMGFDKYLFWFRFTFYIAVAFFLYNRVSRIINIIILDDVREEAAQARSEARERRKG